MDGKRFALQPLLEERKQREERRRAELAHAHRAHEACSRSLTSLDRRYDEKCEALGGCAARGDVAGAQRSDAMLRVLGSERERQRAILRAHENVVGAATAALAAANRERRTLERLRERLERRRAGRPADDD